MTPTVPRVADAQIAAQDLSSARGAYSPIELLLETNVLGYDEYRAWRRGECHTLDDALADVTHEIRALVERLDSWARSLHLHAEKIAFYGIDGYAGTELIASNDPVLDLLLHTEYRAATDRRQRDIFLDTSETEAVDDLVASLSTRDAGSATAHLRRLRGMDAKHWALREARVLIEALNAAPPSDRQEGLRQLNLLEHRWLPAACAVLRTDARDFITPSWRAIGDALEDGTAFDTTQPRQHASWAYLNGLDWAGVRRTVHSEASYRTHPVLLCRLAEAEWRLRNRKAALGLWFTLCWQAPDHFEEAVAALRFPDAAIRRTWQRLPADDAEPLTTVWFPARMVLEDTSVARAAKPSSGGSDPERAFDLLLKLIAGGSDREDMENGRALQGLAPKLFERYLASLDA